MNKLICIFTSVLMILLLSACKPAPVEPEFDMSALRQDVQKKTERIYWIHLRIDTASTEILNAEKAAREGNESAAEFHVAEAYRSLGQADEALLELGKDLQELVGLDQAKPGG